MKHLLGMVLLYSVSVLGFSDEASQWKEISSSKNYSLLVSKSLNSYTLAKKSSNLALTFKSDSYSGHFSYIAEYDSNSKKYLFVFVETKPERELTDGFLQVFRCTNSGFLTLYAVNIQTSFHSQNFVLGNILTPLSMDDGKSVGIPVKISIENDLVKLTVLLSSEGRTVFKELLLEDTIMGSYSKELVKKLGL